MEAPIFCYKLRMSDEIQIITSLQNPRIKQAVRLRDRRDRDEAGLFLIEGRREVARAIDNGWELHTLFFCNELFTSMAEADTLAPDREPRFHPGAVSASLSGKPRSSSPSPTSLTSAPRAWRALGSERHSA